VLSRPMGRFPWDSHRNDIPMDKPANLWGKRVVQAGESELYELFKALGYGSTALVCEGSELYK